MRIDDHLRIVIPISKGINAYHTPISREVFEIHYRIISATQARIFGKGLLYAAQSGTMIARLRLLDEGRIDAAERGEFDDNGDPKDGGALDLLKEIKRLTMILAPGTDGYDFLPVDVAISTGVIDTDDWLEVESSILFFTCPYAIAKKKKKSVIAKAICGVMEASTTSLDPTEWIASLPKSTAEPATKAAPSSIPC